MLLRLLPGELAVGYRLKHTTPRHGSNSSYKATQTRSKTQRPLSSTQQRFENLPLRIMTLEMYANASNPSRVLLISAG